MGGHWNCALQTSDSLSRICTPSAASFARNEVSPAPLLVLLVLSTGSAATGSTSTGSTLTGALMVLSAILE